MKRCFKCGQEKDRSEFYAHPQMGDGLLGKCKDCTKRDSMQHREKVISDPAWIDWERGRCREKARVRREVMRELGIKEDTSAARARWYFKNKHKIKAQHLAKKAEKNGVLMKPDSCQHCGLKTDRLHKHHHDYSRPLDVKYLCSCCHGMEHWKKPGEPVARKVAA